MLLEGGPVHAQRRLQLQQAASTERTSGHKLKTKKGQISCSRNYCRNITYYDIKRDGSIQKSENFNFKYDSIGPTILESESRIYSILQKVNLIT